MGTADGEKPRTTIVREVNSGDERGWDVSEVSSEALDGDSVVVDPDGSNVEVWMTGFWGGRNGSAICGSGAVSGSFSWMIDTTIFSKSSDVMWRPDPRLRLLAHEFCRWILGRMSTGADSGV
jgi:hypothetical protein